MVDKVEGAGEAGDATVAMTEEERTAADKAAGDEMGRAAIRADAEANVASAQKAVERAHAAVANAEDALAKAKAELEGLD